MTTVCQPMPHIGGSQLICRGHRLASRSCSLVWLNGYPKQKFGTNRLLICPTPKLRVHPEAESQYLRCNRGSDPIVFRRLHRLRCTRDRLFWS